MSPVLEELEVELLLFPELLFLPELFPDVDLPVEFDLVLPVEFDFVFPVEFDCVFPVEFDLVLPVEFDFVFPVELPWVFPVEPVELVDPVFPVDPVLIVALVLPVEVAWSLFSGVLTAAREKASSAIEDTRHAAKNKLFFFIFLDFIMLQSELINSYTTSAFIEKKKY